jgi:uncharacterized membrane protein
MTATLTVWKFPTAEAADKAEGVLVRLQKEGVLTLVDAATVSWPEGARKPKTRQLHSLVGAGTLTGTFWGMLFGILFFMPLLGAAIGAATGAIGGKFTDIGIDDTFIDQVRAKVTPGTSALFLLTTDVVLEKVRGAFPGGQAELIHTNLDAEQERNLREVFAGV